MTPNGIMMVGPDGSLMPLQQQPPRSPGALVPMGEPVPQPPPPAQDTPQKPVETRLADDDEPLSVDPRRTRAPAADEMTAEQDFARRKVMISAILGKHAAVFGVLPTERQKASFKARVNAIQRPFQATKIIGEYIEWLHDIGIRPYDGSDDKRK